VVVGDPLDPPVTITGRFLNVLAVKASMEATVCTSPGWACNSIFR